MSQENIKMVVTDLDGTLLNSERELSQTNRQTLERLGKQGVIRVVATGRSVYSWENVADENWPIDYLIFSCGSGIISWPDKIVLSENHMPPTLVQKTIRTMKELKLCFQVHEAIPDNHRFHSFCHSENIPSDFITRCGLYEEHILSENGDPKTIKSACHVIAITEHDNYHALDTLRKTLPELNVVRATSPLDHKSMWIEIYPPGVTKGHALLKLCDSLRIDCRTEVIGVGNDYNDTDFLDIVAQSFIVENAPDELKEKYTIVPTNDNNGFSSIFKENL